MTCFFADRKHLCDDGWPKFCVRLNNFRKLLTVFDAFGSLIECFFIHNVTDGTSGDVKSLKYRHTGTHQR
ncbi:hypothetical protein D3C87_1972800 [compost metagenome]